MRKWCVLGLALAMASTAYAAPNVANATQKGSLLIWPDIRVDNAPGQGQWDTLIRISNDSSTDVNVLCYWMDGNKNRIDIGFRLTANQPFWFDARTGRGTTSLPRFPAGSANGFDNPHLITPGFASETADDPPKTIPVTSRPYGRGMLACWVVDAAFQFPLKWNHLAGTATVYNPNLGAYEYNAFSFFVPTGVDLAPVCVPPGPACVPQAGVLNLNGIEYDQCPMFLNGQFTPEVFGVTPPTFPPPTTFPPPSPPFPPGYPTVPPALPVLWNRLVTVGCFINLNQDWTPVFTKLEFEVWNEDEVRFTGAFECADTWHETEFNPQFLDETGTTTPGPIRSGGFMDSGAQNFSFNTLQTYAARYRVRGVKSTQCPNSQATGLLGVQSSLVGYGPTGSPLDLIGTTTHGSGKVTGRIVYDPSAPSEEGGIK